ncbi:VOC family protein [Tateyamaria omphalii]|uniref:VOC domain-containing protein n=1 Tax=Tateyamaria omphalii TaxID=299262 RepID=A0A1P8MQS5_9RHOB|nr:VOC family protein [Tateyamaria omphalii]APX10426.1 hypothetical protein BWR18_00950 [Tateyamaria omphalii]
MSLHLALLKIPVSDLKRSVAFYEAVLGCNVDFVAQEFGWAQFSQPAPGLALYVPGAGGGNRSLGGSLDFHLSAPDLEATLERVRHVAETAKIYENADGSGSLELEDPDGNVLKIMGAAQ